MNLAAGFLALFIALLGAAQTKAPDDAAEQRLDRLVAATGLTFEKSSSGLSNVLTYDHDAGRKQKVFVARAPDRADGLVFHRVYTTVWTDGKNPPDAALLRRVFSQSKKFGAFYLYVDSKGAQAIRFGVLFDATHAPDSPGADDPATKRLADTIAFVNAVGEEVDHELNGDADIQ